MSNSKSPRIDALEPRTLLSQSQIVGYLQSDRFGHTNAAQDTIDINKIDWSALTQINYFTFLPSSQGVMPDNAANNTKLDQVVAAAHAHGVKVVITLGGANQDGTLQDIISDNDTGNATIQAALATSLNTFQTNHHIDGVDFDWEPLNPSLNQINNYGQLIKTVQQNTNMLVSAAVNPELLPIRNVNDGGASSRYVLTPTAVANIDSIGVMAYDFATDIHSPWQRSVNSLDGWSTYLSTVTVNDYATGQHVSKEKLLFGLPFYGRAGDQWGTNPQSYRDIVNRWLADQAAEHPGTTPVVTPDQDALWGGFANAFGGAGAEWYFNGKNTINSKTGYALDSHVGGVMIWDLGQDHYDSSLNYTNYSLLPGIRDTVNARSTMTVSGSAFLPDAAHQQVTMTLSSAIDAGTVGPADLELLNRSTGATINTAGLATSTYNAATKTVTWSFNTSPLSDGNYRATLRAGAVRDAAGTPLSANGSLDFFVLAGDATHDRAVNFDDLVIIAQNYNGTGKTFAQGDFNYDTKVDFNDLVIMAQQYNKTMPALGGIVMNPGFSDTTIAAPSVHGKKRPNADVLA